MNTVEQLIEKGLRENPEVALVLEIAERTREASEMEPPQEIYVSSDAASVPPVLQQGASEFFTACLV